LLKNFKEEKVQGPYIQQTISPLVNLLTRLFNTGPKVFLREESVPTKSFTARQRQGIQIHISTLYSVSLRVSQSNRFLTGSSGIPTARTTIQAVPKDELQVDKVKSILAAYNLAIEDKLGHDPDKLAPYIERMLKMTF